MTQPWAAHHLASGRITYADGLPYQEAFATPRWRRVAAWQGSEPQAVAVHLGSSALPTSVNVDNEPTPSHPRLVAGLSLSSGAAQSAAGGQFRITYGYRGTEFARFVDAMPRVVSLPAVDSVTVDAWGWTTPPAAPAFSSTQISLDAAIVPSQPGLRTWGIYTAMFRETVSDPGNYWEYTTPPGSEYVRLVPTLDAATAASSAGIVIDIFDGVAPQQRWDGTLLTLTPNVPELAISHASLARPPQEPVTVAGSISGIPEASSWSWAIQFLVGF